MYHYQNSGWYEMTNLVRNSVRVWCWSCRPFDMNGARALLSLPLAITPSCEPAGSSAPQKIENDLFRLFDVTGRRFEHPCDPVSVRDHPDHTTTSDVYCKIVSYLETTIQRNTYFSLYGEQRREVLPYRFWGKRVRSQYAVSYLAVLSVPMPSVTWMLDSIFNFIEMDLIPNLLVPGAIIAPTLL